MFPAFTGVLIKGSCVAWELGGMLELWRLLENVQMQGARNPEESPPKSGICERRRYTYVAVTCPVESA
jgi:hypothetical protein